MKAIEFYGSWKNGVHNHNLHIFHPKLGLQLMRGTWVKYTCTIVTNG
jgi:hypothetical protein